MRESLPFPRGLRGTVITVAIRTLILDMDIRPKDDASVHDDTGRVNEEAQRIEAEEGTRERGALDSPERDMVGDL